MKSHSWLVQEHITDERIAHVFVWRKSSSRVARWQTAVANLIDHAILMGHRSFVKARARLAGP